MYPAVSQSVSIKCQYNVNIMSKMSMKFSRMSPDLTADVDPGDVGVALVAPCPPGGVAHGLPPGRAAHTLALTFDITFNLLNCPRRAI